MTLREETLPTVSAAARKRIVAEVLVASGVVTAVVTAAAAWLPDRTVAMAVGLLFLVATWALVWRHDDAHVERFGLALGGLVLPGRIDGARVLRHFGAALGWALALAAFWFVPFFFGWRTFWRPHAAFALRLDLATRLNDAFGQVVMVALPEEAFYRGYVQSRLNDAFPSHVRVFGASLSLPALVGTSLIFALGHVATLPVPARLAVFFPSLAFGWLRARTGGIGASVAFHAFCNVFSEILGQGYGLY